MVLIARLRHLAVTSSRWTNVVTLVLLVVWATHGHGMTDDSVATLRKDTRHLFYHGYTNYLTHAFPEDELKPISCKPQTRNRDNPADIGLNDVLGNYSLTLIDSLSTLAILASGEDEEDDHDALHEFQSGVRALVNLYGDGTEASCGSRACGFDLDSKVQVFETNIRGVGGLLSAHLFAIGELPIRGYEPAWVEKENGTRGVDWNGWTYEGQLLRLAHDLAVRLLPAFNTSTKLPYPRVNLRTGIPFYQDAETGICRLDGTSTDPREITETCTAGAGSLVLEFTTLSRLTDDYRFEILAKDAFWAVWNRRSSIDLVGGGIDAETGQWILPSLAGIGAGVDSFFEYALKSHILLSNLPYHPDRHDLDSPDRFLDAWQQAYAAVRRHVYRSSQTEKHPYYGQVDPATGAPRFSWVDNLSAYYPGLLTLAGELEEAIESHLLYSALWTRYRALPERWHVPNAFIDPNFKHWAGRPEFIESTYYLYQATKDPYYLHVGEMALRDIRRRCWAKCGWADLGDVVSGEQRDRMESFFLGETAKYLYLLFESSHPLNHLDAPVVFTTEGHPLVIPKSGSMRAKSAIERAATRQKGRHTDRTSMEAICPAPPPPLPLTVSNVANRADLFHAAAVAQLHLAPNRLTRPSAIVEPSADGPGISIEDVQSPTNYTFYPWTLPRDLIPVKGTSSPTSTPVTSTLTFPDLSSKDASGAEKGLLAIGALQKVLEGVVINSLSNVRLNMVQEPKSVLISNGDGTMVENPTDLTFRVHGIANWPLGRDEKVLLSNEALRGISPTDPHFMRIKDLEMVDLIIDAPTSGADVNEVFGGLDVGIGKNETTESLWEDLEAMISGLLSGSESSFMSKLTNTANSSTQREKSATPNLARYIVPAILPTGPGTAPLPASMDNPDFHLSKGKLPFRDVFFLDDTLCTHPLPADVAKSNQILIVKRGGCSFGDKIAKIPSFAPSDASLQLLIVLSVPNSAPDDLDFNPSEENGRKQESADFVRPLLDRTQMTPNGFERRHPIAMVMVDASSPNTVDLFRRVAHSVASFDAQGKLVQLTKQGDKAEDKKRAAGGDSRHGRAGMSMKRRYWFESNGVLIENLIML